MAAVASLVTAYCMEASPFMVDVHMGIDQARHYKLAREIDHFSVLAAYIGSRSHFCDLVSVNDNGNVLENLTGIGIEELTAFDYFFHDMDSPFQNRETAQLQFP